jgi:hypothetical protein
MPMEPDEATEATLSTEPTEATNSAEETEARPTGSGGDDAERIVLTLTGDAYRKLKGTADRSHSTVADLVKNGLALAEWLEEENSRGSQVLIKRGGRIREVNLRDFEEGS